MNSRTTQHSILKRIQSYGRHAARHYCRMRTMPRVNPSSGLAEAIAARYRLLERRWPALAHVFQQIETSPAQPSTNQTQFRSDIFISARLLLNMVMTPSQTPRVIATQDHFPGGQQMVMMPSQMQHAIARKFHFPSVHRDAGLGFAPAVYRHIQTVNRIQDAVLHRIMRRTVRVEGESKRFLEPTRSTANPSAFEGGQRSVNTHQALTLRKQARVESTGSESISQGAEAMARNLPTAPRQGMASEVAQRDITRITDQVLQALDRRIVAQRERMGRV